MRDDNNVRDSPEWKISLKTDASGIPLCVDKIEASFQEYWILRFMNIVFCTKLKKTCIKYNKFINILKVFLQNLKSMLKLIAQQIFKKNI